MFLSFSHASTVASNKTTIVLLSWQRYTQFKKQFLHESIMINIEPKPLITWNMRNIIDEDMHKENILYLAQKKMEFYLR